MKGWGVKLKLENNSISSWGSVCAYWMRYVGRHFHELPPFVAGYIKIDVQ